MPAMRAPWTGGVRFPLQLALFCAAAIAILAGASFNIQGRSAELAPLAILAALLAFAAGVFYLHYRVAAAMAVAALLVTVLGAHFDLASSGLWINVAGLLCLVLGGVVGFIGYTDVTDETRSRLREVELAKAMLEEQHRIFLAATESLGEGPADVDRMTAYVAHQTGAAFASYYVVSSESDQFVPQGPGFGLERVRLKPVTRRKDALVPLLAAVEKNQDYVLQQASELTLFFDMPPTGFPFEGALVVPMPVGEHVGGFCLIGNKPGGFSADDRRLAGTLTLRAGAQLANAHMVALSRKEQARYALLNELVKEASGRPLDAVFELVLAKGSQLIRYDAARVAIFQADGTYVMAGGSAVSTPVLGSPLDTVRQGETVIRKNITQSQGLYSGLQVAVEGAALSEALVPIRGKDGVIGCICLGRTGGAGGFASRDVPTLEELGAMAGLAVENSRILQQVSGQAVKLDTALNALGEVSQALTTVTQGAGVLVQKTLETSARLFDCRFAIMTRAIGDTQRVGMALGFPPELRGTEFQNGQGVIGAVMLSGRPTAVTDISSSWELADPVLAAFGARSALCVPMHEGRTIWGTLSVFDGAERKWTDDDLRVLGTLGNEAVVAIKNAELYDESKKMIWELSNLHESLKAITSTIELDQVLELVLGSGAKAAEAQIGCLALLDEDTKLRLVGSFGTDHSTAEKLALGVGGEICDDVIKSRQAFMQYKDKHTAKGDSPLDPLAVLCVPVMLRQDPIGVVFLANYAAGRPFNDDHKRLLTALAAQAAVAIDNARLFKDREEVMISALHALAAAVDARDPYTAGHSQRVTQYSLMIARQMNYAPGNAAAWRKLEQGGLLHDIGKIAVPDAVLSKPGRLTDEEFEIMKSHPVKGYEILKGLKMLTDELEIVRSHHERFDGKGYPDHKPGDQLPIFVWIVSAADAIDAMTSDRPYRKGMSMQVALDEIAKGAGTHFHPDVAEAVLDGAHAGKLQLIKDGSMYANAPAVGAFENPRE
jgi:putative nucleotidyltransferase with HDIG domain